MRSTPRRGAGSSLARAARGGTRTPFTTLPARLYASTAPGFSSSAFTVADNQVASRRSLSDAQANSSQPGCSSRALASTRFQLPELPSRRPFASTVTLGSPATRALTTS